MHKSKQDLLVEVRSLRAQNNQLQERLLHNVQRSDSQKYAELIIDNSPAILFRRLAAEDLKKRTMVYVSPNIARFGYRAEDFMNNRIMFRDILYEADAERIREEIQEYVHQKQETYTQTYRIVTREGAVRWIEDRTSVVDDPETGNRYHQGIVIDIHRRKEAEEKLRKSEEKYRRILETTAEGYLLLDNALRIVDLNRAICNMTGYTREQLMGRDMFELITEAHRPFFIANREDLFRNRRNAFECDLKAGNGAIVSVLVNGNTLQDDAGSIMGNMAFVTDMREHKKALLLAGEVQKSLLPLKAPQLQGLDIAGQNRSCDEIGGDYFDYLMTPEMPQSPLSVVVGDISGHGVDSALLMTTARAFLRMRASQPGTPADIVTAMNQHLTKDVFETGKFMTLFYLTIDAQRHSIEWIRAGHEPAWLFDPETDCFEELKGPGMALGVDENFEFQSNHRRNLRKGQVIIVSTDGIWEGHNKAGEMFGKQRFQAIIRNNSTRNAEAILKAVFDEQRRFTQDARAEDDLTVVIVKVTQQDTGLDRRRRADFG